MRSQKPAMDKERAEVVEAEREANVGAGEQRALDPRPDSEFRSAQSTNLSSAKTNSVLSLSGSSPGPVQNLSNARSQQAMALASWPPPGGPSGPTISAANAVLSVSSSIRIKAPAPVIFDVLRDTAAYPQWNSFVPQIKILSQPPAVSNSSSTQLSLGTSFVMYALMDVSKPNAKQETQERVTHFSTPEKPDHAYLAGMGADATFHPDRDKVHRIAWKAEGSWIAQGLTAERFHELIPTEGGTETEVRTFENMSGPLAYLVKMIYLKDLQKNFRRWVEDLKKRAESLSSGRS